MYLSSLIEQEFYRDYKKLNKKSLMYCYPIYTNSSWSMLTINNPTLRSMYYS